MKPLRLSLPCRVREVGRTGYKIDADGTVNEERCWWVQIELDPDDPAETMRVVLPNKFTENIRPNLVPGDTIELIVTIPVEQDRTDANG